MPRPKSPTMLKGVKPADLDFEDAEPKVFGDHAEWPEFVTKGLALLKNALAKLGIDMNTESIPSPDALLHRLIELVEKSPAANWQKWLVLSALKWLDGRLHDHDSQVKFMEAVKA